MVRQQIKKPSIKVTTNSSNMPDQGTKAGWLPVGTAMTTSSKRRTALIYSEPV